MPTKLELRNGQGDFLTRSKQRRGYIAGRIAEGLARPPAYPGDENAGAEADGQPKGGRRLGYQLPAWIALACFVAIPVVILAVLLAR